MLFSEVTTILSKEAALVRVFDPAYVIGGICGDYDSLEKIASRFGLWYLECTPATHFIFLGNYSNGGKQSLESLLFILALKSRFPEQVILLRGEQEMLSNAFFDSNSEINSIVFQLYLLSKTEHEQSLNERQISEIVKKIEYEEITPMQLNERIIFILF